VTSGRVTVIIIAAALVAIVAIVVSGIDFGGGDDDSGSGGNEAAQTTGQDQPEAADPEEPEDEDDAEEPAEPEKAELPENPDDTRGSDDFALTRPANLRRALAVLDERRREVEGVFDGLRVAPGRIDTVIVHPDDRRTNIQVRPDFAISFESTHDFPTQADFRKGGLSARDVDVSAPARLLRGADRLRPGGSAAEDVDYCVIGKDIIDFNVDISCYMRIRTARPRAFLKEQGEALRAIG
jgi:hypothetical protein